MPLTCWISAYPTALLSMKALPLPGTICPPVEDKEEVRAILAKVKALSLAVKRDLNDEEYTKIYHEVVG